MNHSFPAKRNRTTEEIRQRALIRVASGPGYSCRMLAGHENKACTTRIYSSSLFHGIVPPAMPPYGHVQCW